MAPVVMHYSLSLLYFIVKALQTVHGFIHAFPPIQWPRTALQLIKKTKKETAWATSMCAWF